MALLNEEYSIIASQNHCHDIGLRAVPPPSVEVCVIGMENERILNSSSSPLLYCVLHLLVFDGQWIYADLLSF